MKSFKKFFKEDPETENKLMRMRSDIASQPLPSTPGLKDDPSSFLSPMPRTGGMAAPALPKLHSDTHSVIDGLNRSKNAMLQGKETISARIIDQKDIGHLKLSPEQIQHHEAIAKEARAKGDYFTSSRFGDDKNSYLVSDVLKHASENSPIHHVPTTGFVQHQVDNHWQGNMERTKKADISHPILIMKH